MTKSFIYISLFDVLYIINYFTYHRDYSFNGGSVSLGIYDDRLEIWNYGLFPRGVSLNNLTELNKSIPRNPLIANVLYYHKICETWGRGVHMIMEECVKAGHPKPFYEQNSLGTLLTIPFKHSLGAGYTTQSVNSDIPSLTIRQKEIISILKQYHELTKEEIRFKLSKSISERWLRNELNALKDSGYITYKGNTRSRKWSIK